MLNLRQEALLALLNPNSVFDFSVLSGEDWAAIQKESVAQTVTLLALDGTEKCKKYIPKDIYDIWFNLSLKLIVGNNNVLRAQENLLQIMEQNRFPYIILKGLASASYYPQPQKRILGDVDFLIDKSFQQKVETTLTEAGYKKELDEHICHRVFKKPHEHLEMHFAVAGIPTGKTGDYFNQYLQNAESLYFENQNPNFHNPVPKNHAVIILLHSVHHLLGEGLGLRHLCDWAYFVDKTHKESFWQNDFLPLLEKTGTLTFAATLTKTAHLYLGTACPDWAKDIPNLLCEGLIEDVFASGNFGRKNKERAGAGKMISQNGKNGTKSGKIKNQFLTLKNSMYYLYPFLHKWKILYPFIFVWRILRYIILMLLGKRPSLLKSGLYANQRLALYKQFNLYETKEN